MFEEVRHPRVESVGDLAIAVNRARGRPAVMVYTLVERSLREEMRRLCRRARVHYCDLLGHPIDSISRVAGVAARMEPGVRAPLDDTYFKRIEAIEFAVRFDDGVGGGLDDADIVLVGVSRTSKTPLSIFLGYLGHKAANVPIVKGVDPPQTLFEIDRAKIVGLTIDPERLADPGGALRSMGAPRLKYANLEAVFEEFDKADRIHRRLRCPVINVSDLWSRRRRCGSSASWPSGLGARRRRRREPAEREVRAGRLGVRRDMAEKGWVPARYWALWWSALALAMVLFYVVLTPIWLGLRGGRGLPSCARARRTRGRRSPRPASEGARRGSPQAFAGLVLPPAVPQREEDQRVATPETLRRDSRLPFQLLAEHDAPYGSPQESRHPDPPRQVEPDDAVCSVHRQVPELRAVRAVDHPAVPRDDRLHLATELLGR